MHDVATNGSTKIPIPVPIPPVKYTKAIIITISTTALALGNLSFSCRTQCGRIIEIRVIPA